MLLHLDDMPKRQDMLKVEAAAHLAGVHPNTIRNLIHRHEITAYRPGYGGGRGTRLLVPTVEVMRVFAHVMPHAKWPPPDEARWMIIRHWHQMCGTSNDTAVVHWLADGTFNFWMEHPELSSLRTAGITTDPW